MSTLLEMLCKHGHGGATTTLDGFLTAAHGDVAGHARRESTILSTYCAGSLLLGDAWNVDVWMTK